MSPTKKTAPSTPTQVAAAINKHFGEGTMTTASDPALEITRVPTGILSIDMLLGGGFARGRHTEIYGTFNVGKTYACFRLIAAAQALGLRCGFFDAERSLDPKFAKAAGVDTSELDIPNRKKRVNGNRLIDLMEMHLYAGQHDVLILDSIAALLPQSEQESQMDASSMGMEQAKMMSKAMRKLTTANDNTVLVYINQTRESVGTMFGPRLRTSGGVAMSFYAGTRLEMSRGESIKRKASVINPNTGKSVDKEVIKGHRVLLRVAKEKTGGAKTEDKSTFVFDYDIGGADNIEDLIYLGRTTGIVHIRNDSWWVEGYESEKKHGRPNFKKWLTKSKAVAEDLEERIRDHMEQQRKENDERDGTDRPRTRRVSRRKVAARKIAGTRVGNRQRRAGRR